MAYSYAADYTYNMLNKSLDKWNETSLMVQQKKALENAIKLGHILKIEQTMDETDLRRITVEIVLPSITTYQDLIDEVPDSTPKSLKPRVIKT